MSNLVLYTLLTAMGTAYYICLDRFTCVQQCEQLFIEQHNKICLNE